MKNSSRKRQRTESELEVDLKKRSKNGQNDMFQAQRYLYDKLNGFNVQSFHRNQEKLADLHTLLAKTVETGENNSVLLVGPRHTGKSQCVRKVVDGFPTARVVWLNGLLHTDDRAVIETIISELQFTLSDDSDDANDMSVGSIAAKFNRLFQLLRDTKHTKPIVFVLEEFDLFAAHPRQALLYNLFDIVQHCCNSFAVVGITNRHDYIDLLEKRVKSRFSHRQISFYPCSSFEEYVDLAKELLQIDDESPFPASVKKRIATAISKLFDDDEVNQALECSYDISKSVAHLTSILKDALDKFSSTWTVVSGNMASYDFVISDSVENQCRDLNELEMSLLAAISRLEEKSAKQYNFELIYKEYFTVASLQNVAQKKSVAMKAFQNLIVHQLIVSTEASNKCPKEFQMVKSAISAKHLKKITTKTKSVF